MPNFDTFREDCDRRFREQYGATWDDLCGDDEFLVRALMANETVEEFVEWFAEHYGLDTLEEMGVGGFYQ